MEESRGEEIPKTHSELIEFIDEHREQIRSDWKLLSGIIKALDELLQSTECMCDLHKDTTIILETVKIQQSMLLNEFRGELTFERLLNLAESNSLDDFFENVKASSQGMTFIDHLDFNYRAANERLTRQRTQYDRADAALTIPSTLEHVKEDNDALQSIKEQVLSSGMIEYFRLICDRESFSKTVINAFNVALALRMGLISLKSIDSVICAVPYEAGRPSLGHSVLEITPKQYERIKDAI